MKSADLQTAIPAILSYSVFFVLLTVLMILNINDISGQDYDWGLCSRLAPIVGVVAGLAYIRLSPSWRRRLQKYPLFVLVLGLAVFEIRHMGMSGGEFRVAIWGRIGLIGVLWGLTARSR